MEDNKIKICVMGLGYVGLPLAVKFAEKGYETYGLDLKKEKIEELKSGIDTMNEVDLKTCDMEFTTNPEIIKKANFIIVAVPTPVDSSKKPDITLLRNASEMVGKYIRRGSYVVFESTVYPGCTEEDCVPIIDEISGLCCGKDWFVGYSPERANPGDKEHTVDKIVKVVSAMDKKSLDVISDVYSSIVTAGVHKAPTIKVAEAAKVIENTQRDINIGLMNELATIFHKMGINTRDVLDAAGTKWNFLKFTPGLVGGHCIGVDPYYLVHKAEMFGVHPQIITAGRKINDNMPIWIANEIVKMLIKQGKVVQKCKLLCLGLTFKENVNDTRNSKVKEIIEELQSFGIQIDSYDTFVDKDNAQKEFNVKNITTEEFKLTFSKYDGVILAVSHGEFKGLNFNDFKRICVENPIFYDIKNLYTEANKENFEYKSL